MGLETFRVWASRTGGASALLFSFAVKRSGYLFPVEVFVAHEVGVVFDDDVARGLLDFNQHDP